MKSPDAIVFSTITVTRRLKDGYQIQELAGDPMLWKFV